MSELILDADDYAAIMALGQNFEVIGTLFQTGQGTPEGLRMAIGGLREATAVLEGVLERWEQSE